MKRTSIISGISLAILLLVVNFLASRHFVRADLTENKAYTLADATKQILKDLNDVVTVRVYFSSNLPPQLMPVKRGVDDILAEYRQYGGDNFQVEYRDPQADPQTEREVMMLGIQPMQVNVVQKDKQEVARIFMGMLMLHADKKQMVPVDPRDPMRHMEEWLTSAMVQLTREKAPVLGWWEPEQGLQMEQGGGFTKIRQVLSERYTIKPIDPSKLDLDPSQYDTVVVLAPAQLSNDQAYAIDRYLGAGGKMILLLSRINLAEQFTGVEVATGLESLLEAYGVSVPARLVADAAAGYAAFQSGVVTYTMPYPLWPMVSQEGMNQEHPVVSQLEALTLPWVSPIDIAEVTPAGLTVEPLVSSSQRSAVTPDTPPFSLDPEAAGRFIPRSPATPQRLAVVLRGRFPDAVAAGKIQPAPGIAALPRGDAEGELLLVGSAHFLEDRFVTQRQFGEGITFFANMVDHQTIGDALVGIRSRPVTARPIARELSSASKMAIRYSNMLGVPLLIILGGFGAMVMRRKTWQRRRAQFRN